MIVSCPACEGRMRLDRRRLGGKRVTLRCARCREIFKVAVPANAADKSGFSVLIAHSDPSLCAAVEDLLTTAGFSCRSCQDGAVALQLMEASPPHVVVIDVALPGLFAFEAVDKIRSRPGLVDVKILLLSSVYNKMAYKRTPSSLYGADDYIEKHHIPDDLVTKINRLAVDAVPAASTMRGRDDAVGEPLAGDTGQRDPSSTERMRETIRRAEEQEISGAADEEGVLKARRLARIIVSDIALYNQDQVEEGIRQGTLRQLLASEIEEGRRLFHERIPAEICRREDFLGQAFSLFIESRKKELCA